MNTTSIPVVAWICGTILLALILGGLFALAWHGSVTGTAVIGVIGIIVAGVLPIFGMHAATGSRGGGS